MSRPSARQLVLSALQGESDDGIRIVCTVDKDVPIKPTESGVVLWKDKEAEGKNYFRILNRDEVYYARIFGWDINSHGDIMIKVTIYGELGWINPRWFKTPATENKETKLDLVDSN